jgi:drug/metabolite transporter (DMT)-like permease
MKQYSLTNWLILTVLSIIWGCSFYFMKNGLKTFSWNEVAAMRISFSFVSLLPFLLINIKRLKRQELPYYFLVGLFGSGIPAFCFTFAQRHLASGITGVLNSMTPIFTFIIGVFFFALPFQRLKLFGLVTALTGAILLVVFDESENGNSNLWFAIPVFLATISYGISANIVKRYLQNAHPIGLAAAGFTFIGVPAAIYLLTTRFWESSNEDFFTISLASVAALAILGTVLASIIFYALIQKTDSIFASLVSYLIPVVAIILGLADGEKLFPHHLIGMFFILAGIYIINSPNPFRISKPKVVT